MFIFKIGLLWPWLIYLIFYIRWIYRKEPFPFYRRKTYSRTGHHPG